MEMAKEKKVIFEEMSMVEDTPDDLVMELFAEAFWPDHPLGRPILGTRGSVARFKRADLASFFTRVYHPDNILIAAAGHLEHGSARALVRPALRGRSSARQDGRAAASAARPPARRAAS